MSFADTLGFKETIEPSASNRYITGNPSLHHQKSTGLLSQGNLKNQYLSLFRLPPHYVMDPDCEITPIPLKINHFAELKSPAQCCSQKSFVSLC
jgi:hypothetical protein